MSGDVILYLVNSECEFYMYLCTVLIRLKLFFATPLRRVSKMSASKRARMNPLDVLPVEVAARIESFVPNRPQFMAFVEKYGSRFPAIYLGAGEDYPPHITDRGTSGWCGLTPRMGVSRRSTLTRRIVCGPSSGALVARLASTSRLVCPCCTSHSVMPMLTG